MRVVVVGATGNVGTSLLEALVDEPQVDSVLGLARRRPRLELPKVEWAQADVGSSRLAPLFHDADCVVHLAWLIQPSRDSNKLWLIPSEFSHALERFQEQFTADANGKAPLPPVAQDVSG